MLIKQLNLLSSSQEEEVAEENGDEEKNDEDVEEQHDEQQREEVVDGDSTDGAVLVNGSEADEEWGTNSEGNPSA